MKKLFVDIETTGLPLKNTKWDKDYETFPYIVSISWIVDNMIKDFIIKPGNYEIPQEATKIHGITTEYALGNGLELDWVLLNLLKDAEKSEKIIGHNLYFDISIIKANVLRNGLFIIERFNKALHKDKRLCTMMKTIKFVNAKFKDRKGIKYPTLIELYTKLFNNQFNAHNSKDDIIATKECYNELLKLKII